jgi:hypothetical protein
MLPFGGIFFMELEDVKFTLEEAQYLWNGVPDTDREAQEEIFDRVYRKQRGNLRDFVRNREEAKTEAAMNEYGEHLTDAQKAEAAETFSEIGAIMIGNPRLKSVKYMTKFEKEALREMRHDIDEGADPTYIHADFIDAMRAGYAREKRCLDSFRGIREADCIIEIEV